MAEPVYVVPYNPLWPSLFSLERSHVEAVVGPWVETIEHVGSTAVPGLDAKPVIDYLRSPSETAEEYALLKYEVAERFRDDREAYTEAKTGFISTVVERAKALRA